MPEIKKFGPFSLASKLNEFLLFDNFFLDLADFQDFDKFWLFDFLDFLAYFTLLSTNTSTLLLPSFFLEASLLLLFLLEADLLLLILLETCLFGDSVVFSIVVSGATILLKL